MFFMSVHISPDGLSRISATRPVIVIGCWLALALVAAFIAFGPPSTPVGLNFLKSGTTTELRLTGDIESEKAKGLLAEVRSHEADELGIPVSVPEMVVIQSDSLTVDDPAFRAKTEQVFDGLIALGPDVVVGGVNYYLTGDESLVSADRRTTLIPINVAGELSEAIDNTERVVEVTTGPTGPTASAL